MKLSIEKLTVYTKKSLFGFALLAISSVSQADLLIKNAKIVSAGHSSAEPTDVLVSGDKIVKIGSGLSSGSEIKVVDADGRILTAGLFNANTQIGLTEVGAVEETRDFSSMNSRITASLKVADAINPSSTLIPHNRMLGVTHALVQPDSEGGLFAGIAALIQLSEENTIVLSDAGMVVKLGAHGKQIAGGSRAAAISLLRESLEDARDYNNNKNSYNRGDRRDYHLSRHDLEALIPVVERRLPLIVHIDRAVDIERIIDFAKSQKIKLILVGVAEGWRVASKIAASKVPVIIDPIMNLPANYDTLGARLDNAKLLHDAGVTLMFTGMSWHSTHNAYLVRQSAGNAVANGLDYQAAINAMTINPAKVFGLDGVGKVAEGARANLVLWSADPLEPSSNPDLVLIDGVEHALESRATRLRDRYYSRLKSILNIDQ